MSEKCSFSTDRAYLMQYFAVKFMYKSFSVNKIVLSIVGELAIEKKKQMKQNEQKDHRGTKKHYMNYCGLLL